MRQFSPNGRRRVMLSAILGILVCFSRCGSPQSSSAPGTAGSQRAEIATGLDKAQPVVSASVQLARRTAVEWDLAFTISNPTNVSVFIRASEMPWNKIGIEDLVIHKDKQWVRPDKFLQQEPYSPERIEQVLPGSQVRGTVTLCPNGLATYDVSGAVTVEWRIGTPTGARHDLEISFGPLHLGSEADTLESEQYSKAQHELEKRAVASLEMSEAQLAKNDIAGARRSYDVAFDITGANDRNRDLLKRIGRRSNYLDHRAKGNAAMKEGDYEEAERSYGRAIDLEPSEELESLVRRAKSLVLVKRAESKAVRGDLAGAKDDLKRSLWLFPTDEAKKALEQIDSAGENTKK